MSRWRDPNGLGEGWPVPPDYAQPTEEEASAAWWAKRARGAYWRGLLTGLGFAPALAAAVVLIADAACGETIQIGGIYINGDAATDTTTVTIEPSSKPGELAVITFANEYVNNATNDGTYPLAMGDVVTVGIKFTWEYVPLLGSDRIDVIVPPGITCLPEDCGVTVMEGQTGTVVLYDWIGG